LSRVVDCSVSAARLVFWELRKALSAIGYQLSALKNKGRNRRKVHIAKKRAQGSGGCGPCSR
jgi:hypothetical protein